MMRRWSSLLLGLLLTLSLTACGQEAPPPPPPEPSVVQMQKICQLGVMECYYHNVAKFFEEHAAGHWFWAKDEHFWIEYDGVVRVGVDASRVTAELKGTDITISLPPTEILDSRVEPDSMRFIVAKDSAQVTGQDEVLALKEAQAQLEELAGADDLLLSEAQTRVEELLSSYIKNLLEPSGQAYTLRFERLPAKPAATPAATPAP